MGSIIDIFYLIGAILFILGLRGLSAPKTARKGNLLAAAGMLLAIIASFLYPLEQDFGNFGWILGAMAVGSLIGYLSSSRVQMTEMPQLVSLFNGLGGGSAMILALVEIMGLGTQATPANLAILGSTLLIGSISFSGSILAYLKLAGKIKDKHVTLPKHSYINVVLFIISLALLVFLIMGQTSIPFLLISTLVFLIFGWSFVAPIGGADMPVVIALLNSVTGISAATAGLLYQNNIMILGGILVGASGIILTLLMCNAMNRSIWSVILGNFGGSSAATGTAVEGTVRSAQSMDVAVLLKYANKVMLVPGYGLAVAQAQKQAKELDNILTENDIEVVYGIHPVAGRMPGHMNVLLAEVDIDYDKLLELDDANSQLDDVDVVLVVGANDVVNPSALSDESSAIYGMPVLEVWDAQNVIVFKRSMNTGYAGIQNPLFFKDNTSMLFGDAGKTLSAVLTDIKTLE